MRGLRSLSIHKLLEGVDTAASLRVLVVVEMHGVGFLSGGKGNSNVAWLC